MKAAMEKHQSSLPRRRARVARATLAGMIVRCLKAEGVSTVFVLPGGPIMPLIEALFLAGGLRVVMTKHEAGAAFAADGYQRLAGGIGVCVTTAGPGATNAVTPIACAMREGVPLLLITGQPGLAAAGRDPTQDSSPFGIDTVALFRSVTKLSIAVVDPERLVETLQTALRCALAGRPGPVHVAVPADLLKRPVKGVVRPARAYRAEARPVDIEAVERAAQLLVSCRRPLILAGPGVRSARAHRELRAVAERLGVPVATTPRAKGVFPENDPRSLQVFGFGGSPAADRAIFARETDCLLVVGSGLGELSSHAWDARLSRKRIIQIDVDATELAKWAPIEIGVVGDARATLERLARRLATLPRRKPWWPARSRVQSTGGVLAPDRCVGYRALFDDRLPMRPQRVVGELGRVMPADTTLFVDVGGGMTFALHHLLITNENGFHLNLAFASMGHAVAAVVGGKLANPASPAVCLCGDGAFLMSGAEVHSAVEAGVGCVWVVLNNGGQGSVRAGARRQFGTAGRRRGMLRLTRFRHVVDIAAWAEAMGARAFRVSQPSELAPALRAALACGEAAVVDARVDLEEEPPLGMRLKLLDKFFKRKA